MTGEDFQNKLDEIVSDLQTVGRGRTVNILFRYPDNTVIGLPLSSKPDGEINPAELAAVQNFVNTLKPVADTYATELEPVSAASEAFRTAQQPHEALATAAANARRALNDAYEADPNYQAAKTALETARTNPDYVQARTAYQTNNVSENFGNLGDAKGKYVAV